MNGKSGMRWCLERNMVSRQIHDMVDKGLDRDREREREILNRGDQSMFAY